MNAERWKQIDELFDAVLDLPETEREDFLALKTKGDEELKNEVLSLLKAESGSNNFLENSAMGIAAKNLANEKTVVSHYNLIGKNNRHIQNRKNARRGRNGRSLSGATDDKLKRKVALKILPAEFVADDDRVKRFGLEARAVSALKSSEYRDDSRCRKF